MQDLSNQFQRVIRMEITISSEEYKLLQAIFSM